MNYGKLHTIDEAEVRGKRVIVRVDWNVTLGKALEIVDDTRMRATLPTINWLRDNGAKQIILISHLGKTEEKKSIAPVAQYAEKLLGRPIAFYKTFQECLEDKESAILMLENVRLWEGEDKNELEFARELASLGEIYVNEAFGEAHRDSASIVGIAKLLPHYAGIWLAKEVEIILRVRESAKRPMVVVIGGAKVVDKIKLLEVLANKADVILLGGKLANEFVESNMRLTGKAKVMVPIEGKDLLDIGEETRQIYAKEISLAKTLVWNGPMGKVEDPRYQAGTQAIYEAIVQNEAGFTVVGGGDTLAAVGRDEQMNRIDHVSTGGGAMLKLLEAGTLLGIEVLES